jgi:hypothetical protein
VLRFEEAEADCDRALALELNPKTLLRRGTARRGRLDLAGARRDYQHVLSLEPNNKRAPPVGPACCLGVFGGGVAPSWAPHASASARGPTSCADAVSASLMHDLELRYRALVRGPAGARALLVLGAFLVVVVNRTWAAVKLKGTTELGGDTRGRCGCRARVAPCGRRTRLLRESGSATLCEPWLARGRVMCAGPVVASRTG